MACLARPIGGRLTSPDDASEFEAVPADHAGSVLCRLLISHPEVVDIEIIGQTEMSNGAISYSLGVMLPGGRELFVDVEDAPVATSRAGSR
jgi:hypothetical protein